MKRFLFLVTMFLLFGMMVAFGQDRRRVMPVGSSWVYATGGSGTRSDPWTSPSGTGGIREAYDALRHDLLGTIQAPPGFYLVTSPIDFSANDTTALGSSAGPGAVSFVGAGSSSTVLIGSTGGTVIDTTGAGHVQLANFAIVQGANPSKVGILMARAGTVFSRFVQHNKVENVYMELRHDPNANQGHGTIGIYGRSVESSLFVNCEIIADRPLVFTSQNVYGITSPNQPAAEVNSCAANIVQGGMLNGFYSAITLQGAVHNYDMASVTLSRSGVSSYAYPIEVLADLERPEANIYNLNFRSMQVEGWPAVLSTSAPIVGGSFNASYSQVGTISAVLLIGPSGRITSIGLNLPNTNGGIPQVLVGY